MIIKPQFKLKEYENGLYLVSTPLGNLKDITLRAIEVLQQSHYILCEDTRVSKNLLDKYEIKSKLISNHKFNEKKNVKKIIEYLKTGKIISLISDAEKRNRSDIRQGYISKISAIVKVTSYENVWLENRLACCTHDSYDILHAPHGRGIKEWGWDKENQN